MSSVIYFGLYSIAFFYLLLTRISPGKNKLNHQFYLFYKLPAIKLQIVAGAGA